MLDTHSYTRQRGMGSNATCDYSKAQARLLNLEFLLEDSVPRISWPSHCGLDCHIAVYDVTASAMDYWTSTWATALVLPTVMLILYIAYVFCCMCLCRSCGCRHPKPGQQRTCLPATAYVVSLMLVLASAAMMLELGVSEVDNGVETILDAYDDSLNKFTSTNTAAQQLDTAASQALPHLDALIADSSACPRMPVQTLLDARQYITDAQQSLASVQKFTTPLLAQLDDFDVRGKQNQYDVSAILRAALMIPTGLALIGVLLELFRLLVLKACGRCGCTGACTRFLDCASSFIFLAATLILLATTAVYAFVALSSADLCEEPDAKLGHIWDGLKMGSPARELVDFYSLCRDSSFVDDLQAQLTDADHSFNQLERIISGDLKMCPTDDARQLQALLKDAQPLYEAQVLPLQSCTYLQPTYCRAVADGVCDSVAFGATLSLLSQLTLFVTMLLSLTFSACVARELRRKPYVPPAAVPFWDDQYQTKSTAAARLPLAQHTAAASGAGVVSDVPVLMPDPSTRSVAPAHPTPTPPSAPNVLPPWRQQPPDRPLPQACVVAAMAVQSSSQPPTPRSAAPGAAVGAPLWATPASGTPAQGVPVPPSTPARSAEQHV